MKMVSFASGDGGGVGWLEDGEVVDLGRAHGIWMMTVDDHLWMPVADMMDAIAAEVSTPGILADVREFVVDHDLVEELLVEDFELLAPLPLPPRIIALGLNYAEHARETGKEPPEEPIFFAKASTAVIGPDAPVIVPQNVGRVDHEVELAVVLSLGGRDIPRAEANLCVFGYTVLNDVTARDMQSADMAAGRPWLLCKGMDTFAPMGPWLVTQDEMPDPLEVDLALRVNGETRQQGNTRDLIFDIPEIIHRLSQYVTLEPGDVIATGTPSGISPIRPGDVIEAEVEGIGVLQNPVVATQ